MSTTRNTGDDHFYNFSGGITKIGERGLSLGVNSLLGDDSSSPWYVNIDSLSVHVNGDCCHIRELRKQLVV